MTCVLGMIVNREREIRSFTKTPLYRVIGNFKLQEKPFTAEWRAVEGSKYYNSPALYKENGFKKRGCRASDRRAYRRTGRPGDCHRHLRRKENKECTASVQSGGVTE